ncbi:MAG: trypsin-like serine protease, partial [Nitrosospira sp.]
DSRTFSPLNSGLQYPPVELEQRLIDDNEMIKIAGWGNIYDTSVKSIDLKEVEAPLVSPKLCAAPDSHGQSVKANMVCAGYEDERTDACDADWGGPATIHKYGKDYLIGVMSWGDCAGPKRYGVFTRIEPYVGWIKATLGSMRRGPRYYFP